MKKLIALLVLLPMFASAQLAPIYRQFFTTNTAPVVDVVAGSNATVVATTPNAWTRRFTVSSTAGGFGDLAYSNAATARVDMSTNAANATNVYGGTVVADTVTASGVVKGTNGIAAGILTVATLPASPVAGQMCWASDVLTSRGTGDFVYYDGSSWRTRENVIATTSFTNFTLNAWSALLTANGALGMVWSIREQVPQIAGLQEYLNSGSGSEVSVAVNAASGQVWRHCQTGTTTNGYAAEYARTIYGSATRTVSAVGGRYFFSAACDGTDTYWSEVGLATSSSSYGTSGAFFLYDKYLINNAAMTPDADYTNNWICVVANNSSYTYQNTGLPVSTSATAPDRLLVAAYANASLFYTNGVLCYVGPALTQAVEIRSTKIIRKTAGTTSRYLYENYPFYMNRYPTGVTIP